MVNPHSLTNEAMLLLDAMDVQEWRIVHSAVDKRHWRKEGTHHGCGRRGRRAFLAGDVPLMITERETDVPLDNRRDESAHDGEQG